ncbi:MAG: tetratricopeptide repeat protein [Nitrospirota bacterium]|nr:tetratricopeptide repeat protein [Nitrospirota bacterium]
MRTDKKPSQKADKKTPSRVHKRGVVGYSKKSALLEEAITHMNAGKYGRSSASLKELLGLDPHNTEARRLFATLHLRLGSLVTARQAFESLANEAIGRQDFWLAESLLREYLAAGPRCVPFLELLGHVYEEKGDTMAAVAELGKAIDILIEDPDSENPKKPSQLYAKVRELAPASTVAVQFASLFDIQTGEFLGPHPVAPAAVTSLEIDASQPQDGIRATTEESRATEAMPWEQFDGAPPSPDAPPPISSNPVIESLDVPDVLIDPAPVGAAPQELQVPPSEPTGPILEADSLGQDIPPSMSDLPSTEGEQAAISRLAEPPVQASEHRDNGMGDPIVELSPFEGEGLTPRSSEEQTADAGIAIMASVGSPGLSSPMPWEQIENATIRIEEATPSRAPFAQPEGVPLFGGDSVLAPSAIAPPELVAEQLASPTPAQELPGPSESILVDPSASLEGLQEPEVPNSSLTAPPESLAEPLASLAPVREPNELTLTIDQPANPPILPEPEVPTPSAAGSSPTVPFSWNTIFDGVWKFAAGTSSPSSPAALSKPDAISQDARELESVQPEPEPELSAPFITSTPEPPFSFNDSEPLPSPHPPILSEVRESIAETDAIRESDLPGPVAVLFSEESSQPEETPTLSRDVSSSFKMDLPVPPLAEPVEPAREAEPVSFPSFMELQPVAPFPEASSLEPSRSAVIPEAPPAPEPVSTEHHEIPITLFQVAPAPPLSATSSDMPSASPASMDTLSHWSTGEVEVQPHRPSEKKRNWDKEKGEAAVVPPTSSPLAEKDPEPVAEPSRGWESAPSEAGASVVEAAAPVAEKIVPQEDTRPDWVRASESITFMNLSPSSSATRQDSGIESTNSKPEPSPSVAASAVDVLFDSTGQKGQVRTQDRLASPRPRPRFAARVARVRIGFSSFIGSCFSTTRSIALLCLGLALSCVALVVVGIGAVGLAWMVMEVPPSVVYQNLTASPPRPLSDSRKNGYFLLLGFDASAERDPLQAGYERKMEGNELQAASGCMVGDEGKGITTAGASANVVRGWFTSADPVAQLKPQAEAVRSWASQESLALKRYQQWLPMPFEDVGYGQILSPNCAHILLVHRLYLAEGFAQDLSTGLGRLESDMGSWRAVLGQSKTLMVKMLAATAVQDDVAIASGLLTRQDLDGTAIGRLGKIVRPLDQVELSLRWPMQSHFVWATKTVTTNLKNDKADERPLYVALAAAMPLPVQRRSNAYADYYESASKAVAEGRYANLPKLSSFIRTPAVSAVDYVANPIEHIIGIEPLPSWDPYVGRIVETDARLRLASLQVWIRRGPQEGNVLTRLAKAGQAHYDPFTGLPMLVNQQRGVMYSVGQDGKDQEGDPQRDVVAAIPTTQSIVLESSRSLSSPRSK